MDNTQQQPNNVVNTPQMEQGGEMQQNQPPQQPTEQSTEMEQGGQVENQEAQPQQDPDEIILDWGLVYTFFK